MILVFQPTLKPSIYFRLFAFFRVTRFGHFSRSWNDFAPAGMHQVFACGKSIVDPLIEATTRHDVGTHAGSHGGCFQSVVASPQVHFHVARSSSCDVDISTSVTGYHHEVPSGMNAKYGDVVVAVTIADVDVVGGDRTQTNRTSTVDERSRTPFHVVIAQLILLDYKEVTVVVASDC